jgi:uncharacterized membrane protein AbrB (regulator of aidB expression)
MFGLELIFTVCSIVAGAQCRELPPMPLQAGVGIIGCSIAAQIEGAKWRVNNPNWYVARATCRPFNAYAKI